MPTISLGDICDAIADEFRAAMTAADGVTQSFDELKDGIPDPPTLQVYPESGRGNRDGDVERTTFGAGVRQRGYRINVDVLVRQRGEIAEDMKAVVDLYDDLETVLDAQNRKPYFGLDGIEAFAWQFDRVTISYNEILFAGLRFGIDVTVY